MQKIDRNQLAKSNVAGGCCKGGSSSSCGGNGGNGGNPLPTSTK